MPTTRSSSSTMAATMLALLVAFAPSAVQAQAASSSTSSAAPSYTIVTNASCMPIVDLGYSLHRANLFNMSLADNEIGSFYNFSNIRYAAPPTGQHRFAPPQPPATDRSSVNDGSQGRMCPQAVPSWSQFGALTLGQYFSGHFNITLEQINNANETLSQAQSMSGNNPQTNEDCLFLDVVVPETIYNNRCRGKPAPVLVEIYGGGYTEGVKSSFAAAGLLKRSQMNGLPGVVYVSLNYRLGAFGWLSGPDFISDGGTPNAGLHDQRFALEWVQQHIDKFGGDPGRVTLIGESAGGGSIEHQITAYGGSKPVPFQQAIPQSPGFQPIAPSKQQNGIYQRFLSLLGASNLTEARNMSYDKVQQANLHQVYTAEYGSFVYGPMVDGDFVPALPGKLLASGRHAKNIKVMAAHNGNEGLVFTDPLINASSTLFRSQFLTDFFPGAPSSALDYAAETLYPPPPHVDGNFAYFDNFNRSAVATSEAIFLCNTNYLARAFGNQSYGYVFDVPPAFHGEDVAYTYYNNGGVNFADFVFNITVAEAMQDYIVSFAATGTPSAKDISGLPYFKMYGPDASVVDLGIGTIADIMDPAASSRCLWWQQAHYADGLATP